MFSEPFLQFGWRLDIFQGEVYFRSFLISCKSGVQETTKTCITTGAETAYPSISCEFTQVFCVVHFA